MAFPKAFIEHMATAYAEADLVVARAGALTRPPIRGRNSWVPARYLSSVGFSVGFSTIDLLRRLAFTKLILEPFAFGGMTSVGYRLPTFHEEIWNMQNFGRTISGSASPTLARASTSRKVAMLFALAALSPLACSNPGSTVGGTGGSNAGGSKTGGVPSSGGAATGGQSNAGGTIATGGTNAMGGSATGGAKTGGTTTSGGNTATGGAAGGSATTGGSSATGGATATGGVAASGGGVATGGTSATGGVTRTGGLVATGGATVTGGITSTGGTRATGGSAATGGTASTGGTTTGGTTGACTPPKAGTSKSNPIYTDVYTADPAVMVDNCTFYIACGHDQGTGGFVLNEWFLLKSTDMVTWTRTTPMSLKNFTWTNANAWAGQMIKAKNGKYYWYVPINNTGNDRMAIGVAVADAPEGPWKDALGKPLIDDALEMSTFGITNIDQTTHTIDPTVFIDDDGQAYLQYGGFWSMATVKLNPDMITLAGKLTMTTPPNYFESPYLIKRNNVYYEIYAAGSANPTTIDYATSTSPMGPWTRKGTILPIMPKVSGQDEPTNHAGVAEFAGQWYIVYHVSNGPSGGGTYKREVAIDKMDFNSDGSIKPVTPSPALSF
jgi:Glycosyl hydrolases family 43